MTRERDPSFETVRVRLELRQFAYSALKVIVSELIAVCLPPLVFQLNRMSGLSFPIF